MSEEQIIQDTAWLHTRESLAYDLGQMGLEPGVTVIVHSALRTLGWVCGGAVTVVQSLIDVVTEEGTIVMPTQTPSYSDPAKWQAPAVPEEWWPLIYERMPAFDPQVAPPEMMGKIVEVFRTWPGVVRSGHPTVSFAAWGKNAGYITRDHKLEYELGEGSPLARIYELDGWILMLGTGYDTNTSMHLAEYRAPGASEMRQSSPIMEDGVRVWKEYRDIEVDSEIFPEIGAAWEQAAEQVKIGRVGSATVRLMRQREAVDFAERWFTQKREQKEEEAREESIDLESHTE